MKTAILISLICLLLISCRKDRTCQCQDSGVMYDPIIFENTTYLEASGSCELMEANYNIWGFGDTECKIIN